MKKRSLILYLLAIILFGGCGQRQMETPENAMDKFEKFRKKEKFSEDIKLYYTGIGDPRLKPQLTEKINLASDDFARLAKTNHVSEEDYQIAIKNGLDRFSEIKINLDTEDMERICLYFEELMDIVGLESSDGQLNNFLYDFDPTSK